MSTITAEGILQMIDQLSPAEQVKLNQMMEQRKFAEAAPETSIQQNDQRNGVTVKKPGPIPMPDGTLERQWLAAHRHEYADQWVALDGSRLIAASSNHDEVWAAADADGAYLPLITFIENPERITHIIWT